MKTQKDYFWLTLLISVLGGIILPLVLGVKDIELIAYIFASVWFVYAVLIFATVFLIKPGLRIKVSRQKGVAVVRFELQRKDPE